MKSLHQPIKKYILPLLAAAFLISVSWMLFRIGNPPPASAQVSKPILITSAPNSTPTPTPFQPELENAPTQMVGETSTVQPDFASWGDFPAPQVYPAYIQIPPPASIFPRPDGQVYILLLGSDQRPNDGGFRTDTMILVTINAEGKASLTSIPRDLYVYIPGWMMQRINTAQGYGGFDTTVMTFEYNFGIRPDYYVLINFDGFRSIVDDLGGITVNVSQNFSDSRSGYTNGYTVYAGSVEMDSETALWYIRSRYSSSDIDRLRRSQEVLQAIGTKLLTLDGISHLPMLFSAYKSSVETNLTLDAATRLIPAMKLIKDPTQVRRFVIGYDQVYDWVDPGTGAQVLVPIPEEIQKIIQQAITFQ